MKLALSARVSAFLQQSKTLYKHQRPSLSQRFHSGSPMGDKKQWLPLHPSKKKEKKKKKHNLIRTKKLELSKKFLPSRDLSKTKQQLTPQGKQMPEILEWPFVLHTMTSKQGEFIWSGSTVSKAVDIQDDKTCWQTWLSIQLWKPASV